MHRLALASFAIAAIASQSALAQGSIALVGTWKLVSFDTEVQATGERRANYGKSPNGYLTLTSEARLITVITAEGRKAGDSETDRALLHRTMIAYSGVFRVESDQLKTKVETSWNESWNGTEQVRFFKLEGNRLDIITAWAPAPNMPGNPTVRGVLTYERSK